MSLHDLTAHFSLLQSNIPSYECTAVCLSIYLLKDILDTSNFLLTMSKHSYTGFCVGMSKYLGKWFAGLYGETQFNFVINNQTVFQNGSAIFH